MHGLIFRTLQLFVQDTYGRDSWCAVADHAHLDDPDFEAMLAYPADLLEEITRSAEAVLNKPRDAFLEDVGTYLVSHPEREGLRRLLRFAGVDFIEFLHSLDDMPGRAKLAISDLVLPELELRDQGPNQFSLIVTGDMPAFGHVMVGLLRAMADDYGALALLEFQRISDQQQRIELVVVEAAFAEGREFELGGPAAMGGAM
ncbi:MAG: heme NO-binding domain-containing protein [Pelagimonas sp.]|jgi:hypothetical protein|nr:heme NO-binding domain-containing protein [Pelagimonas sp.]